MDKQHIVDEIRRTAVDGKPIGRIQFLAQTGIRESDWSGKYWARWSDAQKEAGFEPRSFNPAFEDEHIFKCVLDLTRKLGRYPTQPEMRLERQTNRSYPDDKAIRTRGKRSLLIAKLIEFCRDHIEYGDVLQILKSTPTIEVATEAVNEITTVKQDGSVYLIRAQGAYKIGCTRALYRRAAEITSQSANGAELLHHIVTDDPEGIEKYWHDRFSAKRLAGVNKQSGEWFALTAEDIKAFKRRKFM